MGEEETAMATYIAVRPSVGRIHSQSTDPRYLEDRVLSACPGSDKLYAAAPGTCVQLPAWAGGGRCVAATEPIAEIGQH